MSESTATSNDNSAERVLELACELIRKPSVSPDDGGCQNLLIARLNALGFHCESLFFTDTHNLWATHGTAQPLFVFAGHTDVVPTGPLDKWLTPPFAPTIKEGYLFGRGAADMKGGLAAMIIATENFVRQYPEHNGRIGFLITSDEEDKWVNGTIKVIEELQRRHEQLDYCVIGEPSSTAQVGDVIKIGRRGAITAQMQVQGKQGHVAYAHLAKNAIHSALPMLDELVAQQWDQGNAHFPPTSLQITRVQAGHANNVIPGELFVEFNMRYSNEQNSEKIQQHVERLCHRHAVDCEIDWRLSGEPFLTEGGKLLEVTQAVIREQCGFETEANTKGGTSDGRFIAKTGAQVLELGPCNATIHQVNESVAIADLVKLVALYEGILQGMLL